MSFSPDRAAPTKVAAIPWAADVLRAANMADAVTTMPAPAEAQRGETDAVIRVEDVHKYYDLGDNKVHALRGVTLSIGRGEFVAVMGASGSGKSTFMNILGCLDQPSSGRYLLEGIDVSTLHKKQLAGIRNQKIGFVVQGFNLLARTTALENADLPPFYAPLSQPDPIPRPNFPLDDASLAAPC